MIASPGTDDPFHNGRPAGKSEKAMSVTMTSKDELGVTMTNKEEMGVTMTGKEESWQARAQDSLMTQG